MADREHHRSRKKKFTLVLVPDEEAAQSRSVRFSPWQSVIIVIVLLLTPLGLFIASLFTTPIGGWLNVPNPEIENRYAKEIVAMKGRMVGMMGQLIELRSYNSMLRNALGEKVIPPASSFPPVRTEAEAGTQDEGSVDTPTVEDASSRSTVSDPREYRGLTTFPAFFPAEGYVTRGYEPEKGHFGLDVAGKIGSGVRACADGYVVFAGWTQDDGNTVILSHAGGYLSFYKHNHTLLKAAGMFVKRGEPVARLGNTGETSLGPHVHFEIWKDGSPRDPAIYLLNPVS